MIGRFVMVKSLLVLALCVPFGWIALNEGRRLYEMSSMPGSTSTSGPANDPAPSAELARVKKSAEAIVGLSDAVSATAIRLSGPPEGSPASGPLADALLALARAREAGHRVIEEARLKAAAAEQEITDFLRQGKFAELEQRLRDYATLEVHDPELLGTARAEVDWDKLEHQHPKVTLDELYDRLDRWTPDTPESTLPAVGDIAPHREAYRVFLDAHGSAKGAAIPLVQEARERIVLWDRGSRLVELLHSRRDRDDQIRSVVSLVAEDTPLPRFEATARRLLRALCGDFLKPEALDQRVLIVSDDQAVPESFPRGEVVVRWKDTSLVTLDKSEFDEYTLPRDKVENFAVPGGGIRNLPRNPQIAPLRGTEYSEAIRAYNAQRAKVTHWSEAELIKLREACLPHKAALSRGSSGSGGPTLIARIDSLLEIIRRHPNLFVASAP
jgi:hypothetical protein